MKNLLPLLTVGLCLLACTSPSEKIENIILYNDSVGYWNYERPRKRAEFHGSTFKMDNKGKVEYYSYSKVQNKRWLFTDFGREPIKEWKVLDDSTFTLMGVTDKIVKYNKDTIWLYDEKIKENRMLLKVKGDLNIEEEDILLEGQHWK